MGGERRDPLELRVAADGEIPEGGVVIVQSGSLFVGVYRIDGAYYAIEDRCSHDDGPLCEGEREGFDVVCPRHGARFDLRSGKVLSLPATEDVEAFPVVVRDGVVYVET
jgi:3-phenylpropionate/trans-cinnamate dioxygenase ferredoxin subunit